MPKKTAVAAKPEAQTASKTPAQRAGEAVLKPSAKPILKATPKASGKQAIGQKAEKVLKEKKPELVRDSLTIPKAEYAVLDEPACCDSALRAALECVSWFNHHRLLEPIGYIPPA